MYLTYENFLNLTQNLVTKSSDFSQWKCSLFVKKKVSLCCQDLFEGFSWDSNELADIIFSQFSRRGFLVGFSCRELQCVISRSTELHFLFYPGVFKVNNFFTFFFQVVSERLIFDLFHLYASLAYFSVFLGPCIFVISPYQPVTNKRLSVIRIFYFEMSTAFFSYFQRHFASKNLVFDLTTKRSVFS